MATYMVGYDLNRPGQDYKSLIDEMCLRDRYQGYLVIL